MHPSSVQAHGRVMGVVLELGYSDLREAEEKRSVSVSGDLSMKSETRVYSQFFRHFGIVERVKLSANLRKKRNGSRLGYTFGATYVLLAMFKPPILRGQ